MLARHPSAPLTLLLGTLATVLLFAPDRSLFLGKDHQRLHSTLTRAESMTYEHLLDAINLLPRHYFVSARSFDVTAEGEVVPSAILYNRFPIGGRLALHLATLPFDDPWRKVYAARMVMIGCFLAAATLAFFALTNLAVPRWGAATATLLAFGSGYHFTYHDMIATQGVVDLFGVTLVFHGMAVFARTERLGQLLAKTCVALLLGWHVYALLAPFVVLGIGRGLARSDRRRAFRHAALGMAAAAVGACALAFNVVGEFLASRGQTPWTDLPTVRSALYRAGLYATHPSDLDAASVSSAPLASFAGWTLDALWTQFQRVGDASLPHVASRGLRAVLDHAGASWVLGGLGLAATLAAIAMSGAAKRGRTALLALVLAGWCWALPMRNAVYSYPFEAMFFVGVPLVLYALGLGRIGRLTWARRARSRLSLPLLPAAGASLCFLCSGVLLDRTRQASVDFEREAALRADVRAIRDLVERGEALAAPVWNAPNHWKVRRQVLLAGRPLHPGAERVVAFEMPDSRSLTPRNRVAFLYERANYEAALADLVAHYQKAMRKSGPLVASECCDVHLLDDRVLYHDRDCRWSSNASPLARFFLHVTPVNATDLPAERREHGFGNYNFTSRAFQRRAGLCFAILRLPPYRIATVHTGEFRKIWRSDRTAEYQVVWEGRFSPAPSESNHAKGERSGDARAP